MSGVNLPMVAYRDLTEAAVPVAAGDYTTDTRWLAFGDDLRSLLRNYRPSGELDGTSTGSGRCSWPSDLRGQFQWDPGQVLRF